MRKGRGDRRIQGCTDLPLQRDLGQELAAMEKGKGDPAAGFFIAESLFSTLTNVNFDKKRFADQITGPL